MRLSSVSGTAKGPSDRPPCPGGKRTANGGVIRNVTRVACMGIIGGDK